MNGDEEEGKKSMLLSSIVNYKEWTLSPHQGLVMSFRKSIIVIGNKYHDDNPMRNSDDLGSESFQFQPHILSSLVEERAIETSQKHRIHAVISP